MHILYIHQYFKTPEESAATRSYWFAKKLISKGHKVTMITATNNLHHKEPQSCNIDGIKVIYVANNYKQSYSKSRKIYSFIKFVIQAVIKSVKVKDVDLIFATSTPLSIGVIALILHFFKRWKYVFEVRDLWPEFPIQIGAIKNNTIISILKSVEKKIYIKSEHIIALSPGMKDGVLSTGIKDCKVTIVPNMSKPDLFYPRTKSEKFIDLLELDKNKLNIIHFGAMGVANGLDYLINTAKILKDKGCSYINFYIVGNGSTLPQLKKMSLDYKLDNVKFYGYLNLYEMSEVVNCCDISFVSFKDLPVLYTNSPNKLFDSLSAGKPIVVNSAGWTKDLVEKNKCGYYVNPQKPEEFAMLLQTIDKMSLDYKEMCNKSRDLSISKFNKDLLSSKIVSVLEAINKQD